MAPGLAGDAAKSLPTNPTVSANDWLPGGLLAVCLLLGGGGSPSPASEAATQVLCAMLLAAAALRADRWDRPGWRCIALAILALALPLFHLVPLPPSIWQALPGRDAMLGGLTLVRGDAEWRPLSVAPLRTFASLLAVLPPLAILWATAASGERAVSRAIVVLVAIAAFSGILGAVQVGTGGAAGHPYAATHRGWVTGLFANRNAAADLFLAALAGLAVLAAGRAASFRLPAMGLTLLFAASLLMTGSRTGIVVAITLCSAAIAFFLVRKVAIARRAIAVGAIGFATVAIAGWALGGARVVAGRFFATGDMRADIWRDTADAIGRYWPWGSGMGTFEPAFAASQRLETLGPAIVNRAHGDYLELLLEAGLPGIAVLLAAAAIVANAALRPVPPDGAPNRLFACAVLGILALHSLVDYPLRTMALGALAAFAVGILVKPRPAA